MIESEDVNVTEAISKLIDQTHFSLESELEKFLLDFFGSYNNAVKLAPDYILEVTESAPYEAPGRYRLDVSWSIREKTEAEKLHDRVDRILEERTKVLKTCIVCFKPIAEGKEIPSIHGPYHKYCVGGR